MKRWGAGVAVLCVVASCGSSSGGGGGSMALDQIEQATCAYRVRCGLAGDMTSCLGAVAAQLGQVGAAMRAGRIHADSQAVTECLAAYTAAACTTSGAVGAENGACARALAGTVSVNGACLTSEECRSGWCAFDNCATSCCKGFCANTNHLGAGAACFDDPSLCAGDDTLCRTGDTATGAAACENRRMAGDACLDTSACVLGLLCHYAGLASTSGICTPPPATGGTCAYDLPCDSYGDLCDSTFTCLKAAAVGEPCKSTADCSSSAVCPPNSLRCTVSGGLDDDCYTANTDCQPGLRCLVGQCIDPGAVCAY